MSCSIPGKHRIDFSFRTDNDKTAIILKIDYIKCYISVFIGNSRNTVIRSGSSFWEVTVKFLYSYHCSVMRCNGVTIRRYFWGFLH